MPIAWWESDASEWSACVSVAAGPDPVIEGREASADAPVRLGIDTSAPLGSLPLMEGIDTAAVLATLADATASEGREAIRDGSDMDATASEGREASADAMAAVAIEAFATDANASEGREAVAAAWLWDA